MNSTQKNYSSAIVPLYRLQLSTNIQILSTNELQRYAGIHETFQNWVNKLKPQRIGAINRLLDSYNIQKWTSALYQLSCKQSSNIVSNGLN